MSDTPTAPPAHIILYDIPGTASKDQDWSPNVWKTRFVLNYKNIPHTTRWVDYPSIAPLCIELNISPTAIRRDGSPYYSVPFIYDPTTATHISDSLAIALHLERTYPNTPRLFPDGAHAAIRAFEDIWNDYVVPHLSPLMVHRVYEQLTPASKVYFRTTREARYHKKLEDIAPLTARREMWEKLRVGLGRVDAYMNANGDSVDARFWFGERVSYADVVMAGWLVWIKRVFGEDSEEWRELVGWHGGRWGRVVGAFERWEYVDNPPHNARL